LQRGGKTQTCSCKLLNQLKQAVNQIKTPESKPILTKTEEKNMEHF
jgi:hypothetical protein